MRKKVQELGRLQRSLLTSCNRQRIVRAQDHYVITIIIINVREQHGSKYERLLQGSSLLRLFYRMPIIPS
jgi:hypothetical protein